MSEPDGAETGGQKHSATAPYRSSPLFDQETLPAALRRAHSTKAGVWGVIRVVEGRVRYVRAESASESILDPETPGLIRPEELHYVEPLGPMKMRVDFYDRPPDGWERSPEWNNHHRRR